MIPTGTRSVASTLVFDVVSPITLVLQIAPAATAGALLSESLSARLDGRSLPVTEELGPTGGRRHVLLSGPGELVVDYAARVGEPAVQTAAPGDRWEALRPSRYCPSDRLQGWAIGEFGVSALDDEEAGRHVQAVRDWVHARTAYVSGSSGPLDDAVDTLLSSQGVCRDFAHLVATAARALELPARLVSVWAPGLSPMDFHAVVEVLVGGDWRVVDATGLAPRHHLARIATGRDAADTAFAEVLGGEATLASVEVTAVVEGELTPEVPDAVVTLA